MALSSDLPQLLKELIQIGIALTSERDVSVLLERIVMEARRFTRAEGGSLFLREGDQVRLAVVQNDVLERQIGESEMKQVLQSKPLPLNEQSLAGYVALTGEIVNLPDAYDIPPERPYALNRTFDAKTGYRTRSVLLVPLLVSVAWPAVRPRVSRNSGPTGIRTRGAPHPAHGTV